MDQNASAGNPHRRRPSAAIRVVVTAIGVRMVWIVLRVTQISPPWITPAINKSDHRTKLPRPLLITSPVNRRRSVLRHVSGRFTTSRIVTLGASGDRRRDRHGRSHLALAPVPSSSSGRHASRSIHRPPLASAIN
jgi:hypothetical protein